MIEPRKKQLRGEKTREKILKISLKLFSEKGYDKVTVDEIVKKSGTSKGSFYQHFSAKSDIFLVRFIEVDDYYREVFRSFRRYGRYREIIYFHTQIDAFSGRRNGQRFNESDLQFRFRFERTYLLFKFKSLTLPNYPFIN
ncbi:helix-turn-helix transcriptional regulator [Peribacillus simplex]|nr:helix-turn-helix transcriptional regulator [Peribacillus simplex]